jgi:ubiquinone biosynthesis protein Coq4
MGQKIEAVRDMLSAIIETSRVPAWLVDADAQKLFIVRTMAQEALDTMEHTNIDLPKVREILQEIVSVSAERENAPNMMPEYTLGHVYLCSARAMLLTKSA